MEESINQRILILIKDYATGNQTRFAEATGIKLTTLNGIIKGVAKPSYTTIGSILKAYPEINHEWLLFGEGQILKNGYEKMNIVKKTEIDNTELSLSDRVKALEKKVKELETIVGK